MNDYRVAYVFRMESVFGMKYGYTIVKALRIFKGIV